MQRFSLLVTTSSLLLECLCTSLIHMVVDMRGFVLVSEIPLTIQPPPRPPTRSLCEVPPSVREAPVRCEHGVLPHPPAHLAEPIRVPDDVFLVERYHAIPTNLPVKITVNAGKHSLSDNCNLGLSFSR